MEDLLLKSKDLIIPWLLSDGIMLLMILISAFIFIKISKKSIEKIVRVSVIRRKHSSKEAEIQREDTLIKIFSWVSKIVILSASFLMIMQKIGIPIAPILGGAGIVGLSVGFGGQYLIRDIISGFFIILENQYRVGDIIDCDGMGGVVEDISLRMTTLRDLDGIVHHIPHGEIKRVSNLSKDFSRVNLDIGVSYNSKLEHVIEVINKVGEDLSKSDDWKDLIVKSPQFLRVDDFADSAIVLKILGETKPLKQWAVAGELRKRLKFAFDKEGIEIPFPQRVIHQA